MKARNIPPIDLLPSWRLYWKPIGPPGSLLDPKKEGMFPLTFFPEKIPEQRERDLKGLRERWQRDDIDLIMVVLREVTCVYTCYECGHKWEETDEWQKAEFFCPKCDHFNSLKYQEQIFVDLAPSMNRFHDFTIEDWRRYEEEGKGWKPRKLPDPEKLMKRKRPSKPKRKKKHIVFEQLELFPEVTG